MPRDVHPLRCIVCGNNVYDPIAEWVRASKHGAVWGLHSGRCTTTWSERGSWDGGGYPVIKPSLEERVEQLEQILRFHPLRYGAHSD